MRVSQGQAQSGPGPEISPGQIGKDAFLCWIWSERDTEATSHIQHSHSASLEGPTWQTALPSATDVHVYLPC